jgi:hypothetical protein
MTKKLDPEKFCEFCAKELLRKTYANRLEDRNTFLRRRFCSLACSESKKGKLTKHGYSWRARKFLKKNCEACGYDKSLHAHHVDQNPENNVEQNIQTLCKHCHNFWHTTQKRLGLSIAGKMCQLYSLGQMVGTTESAEQEPGSSTESIGLSV